MKKIIFFIILFKVFFNSSAYTAEGDALLDLNFVLSNSNAGKKILNELKILDENNKKQILQIENELKQKQNEIKKIKNIISKDEYEKKIIEFNNEVETFNKKKRNLVKSFEEIKKEEIKTFFKSLNEILTEYMRENSISIVLDKKNIIISDKNNDITDEILKISNAKL